MSGDLPGEQQDFQPAALDGQTARRASQTGNRVRRVPTREREQCRPQLRTGFLLDALQQRHHPGPVGRRRTIGRVWSRQAERFHRAFEIAAIQRDPPALGNRRDARVIAERRRRAIELAAGDARPGEREPQRRPIICR